MWDVAALGVVLAAALGKLGAAMLELMGRVVGVAGGTCKAAFVLYCCCFGSGVGRCGWQAKGGNDWLGGCGLQVVAGTASSDVVLKRCCLKSWVGAWVGMLGAALMVLGGNFGRLRVQG